ncbi:hypothetical protein LXL04_021998 [Taraxacum kok-saghyz]
MDRPASLLDEALGFEDGDSKSRQPREGRVVLLEDCVETSGAFVLHHLIKRFLSPNHSSSDSVVIFVAFAQPFSHYDRILRKMGCNLAVQRENKRLIFFDMLMLECPDDDGTEGGLLALYGNIHKAVEFNSLNKNITIIIDDISLLEVAANGSTKDVLNFMHYCHTLTTQFGCTIITVIHDDIYSSEDGFTLPTQLEYLSDITIKAEPLVTGLAADIHGQLTVLNKGLGRWKGKIRNFHYRVKENSVPSASNGDLSNYLKTIVALQIPSELQDGFIASIDKGKMKVMPNRRIPASLLLTPGALLIGDALNMCHPLTGGGMTVALSDVVILCHLLRHLHSLHDPYALCKYLESFYTLRKPVSSTINILAEALYKVFCASHDKAWQEMQEACFEYLRLGALEGAIRTVCPIIKAEGFRQTFFPVTVFAYYRNVPMILWLHMTSSPP